MKKYFYNNLNDTMIIVEFNGDAVENVIELEDPLTIEDEVEEEEVEEIKPKQQKKKETHATFSASYDKEAVKKLIKEDLKPKEIAARTGAPIAIIYNLKSDMKKAGELDDNQPKEQKTKVVGNPYLKRVKEMVDDDHTDEEIYNELHDFMTDAQLRIALEEARK